MDSSIFKKLEWKKVMDNWSADSIVGRYRAVPFNEYFQACHGTRNIVIEYFDTKDEAKQACQDHYEATLGEGLDLETLRDSIENIEPLDGYSDKLKTAILELLEAK